MEKNIQQQLNANSATAVRGDSSRASFYGYTCIGGREEDQDCLAYKAIGNREIFTVCDGMGGHAGGCVASYTAVRTIIDAMKRQPEVIPTDLAMFTAITEANTAIYNKAQQEPSLKGMGTTVTLLIIDDEAAWITHVGDSRIYQLRKGRKVFRTFDHSMVFEQVLRKKITEEEARVHPRSNMLSRALGVMPDIETAVTKLAYRPGDRFVLCCDGVWNTQPEPNIIALMTEDTSAEATGKKIRTTVEELGKASGEPYDNHTMIVVDIKVRSSYRNSILTKIKHLFSKVSKEKP